MPSQPPLPPRPTEKHLHIGSVIGRGVLWGLMIVVYLVLYRISASMESEDSAYGGFVARKLFPLVVNVFLFAGFLAFVSYFFRLSRFAERQKAAVELLNAGRLREAGEAFEANARRSGNRMMKAFSVYNLGIVKLKLGEMSEAASLMGEVERGSFLGTASQLSHHSAGYLSLCSTLAGDLPAAEAWLEVAKRRATGPSVYGYMPVLAEAALLCRRSRFAEVEELFRSKGAEAEGGMPGDHARILRVLRAFAAEGSANPELPRVVAGATPTSDGEFGFLGVQWPEFASFLKRHQLVNAA